MEEAKRIALAEVETQMWSLGRRFRRKMTGYAETLAPGAGFNAYAALATLSQYGSMRQQHLAEHLLADKGSTSRLITELERLGLVEREPDPKDGRAQLITLTAAARTRMEELRGQRHDRFQERMASWTVEELNDFKDSLARYNDLWEQ